MRRLLRPFFVLVSLACLIPISMAVHSAFPNQDGPTPLQEAMGRLQKGQRGLRKLLADPESNRAELMTILTDMEGALLAAIALPPTPHETVAEGERGLWVVGYKTTMASTLSTVLGCQKATLKGDPEALAAAYKTLNENKKHGHDTYQ